MHVKIHKTRTGETLLAVCDSELIDKIFEEGNKQIDLRSDFFKGSKLSNKETADLLRNCDIVNLVGKQAIELGIKEEFLSNKDVKFIAGIPMFQSTILTSN